MKKTNWRKAFLLTTFALLGITQVFADGTKQVSPTNTADGAALFIDPASGVGNYFGAAASQRLQFTVTSHTTENLYFGMHPRTFDNAATTLVTNGFYRILNSVGTVVAGPTAIPTTGTGFISTWAQANAGPNIGGATPTGYTPLTWKGSCSRVRTCSFRTLRERSWQKQSRTATALSFSKRTRPEISVCLERRRRISTEPLL